MSSLYEWTMEAAPVSDFCARLGMKQLIGGEEKGHRRGVISLKRHPANEDPAQDKEHKSRG